MIFLTSAGPLRRIASRATSPRRVRILATLSAFLLSAGAAQATAVTHAQVKAWRLEIRRALFVPQPLPALSIEHYGSIDPAPEVIAEKVSYGSEYGLRIPADVYRPAHERWGRMPAIVIVSGHGGDKSSWYNYYTGMLYARAGAVVLTYDPIGEGERNDEHRDGTSEHDRPITLPTMPARMGGVMDTDVLQAVSYLRSRQDVDPHRIAVLGFSMGTFVAAIAGADSHFHALLLDGGGDLDGPGGYWDSSDKIMCQSGPYHALRFLGHRPAVLYTLNARRGPTFIINGTADKVVAIPTHGPAFFAALRTRVIRLNGSSKNVFTTYFDPGASHRPSWMTRTAASWLNRQLHFPAWRNVSVSTLPIISMRAWAAKVGYRLGHSSGREDRDAGIQMLAAPVPLMTAAELDVMPRAVWNRERDRWVYSSWVAAAEKAAAKNPVPYSPAAPGQQKQ